MIFCSVTTTYSTMEHKPLLLIKLGGSAITDKTKPRTLRTNILRQLARELKKTPIPLVISHGAGSFAHQSAQQYGGKKGYHSRLGIAQVASDVKELNFMVTKTLIEAGLPAVAISPMSMILTDKGIIQSHQFAIIDELLSQRLLPVVYGDVLWDQTWKSTIYSGETTLNHIAIYLQNKGYTINQVIQVGNTCGVYDISGNTIPRITKNSWQQLKKNIIAASTIDVTGGMQHKVEEALKLNEYGISTLLINGTKKYELLHALKGKTIQATYINS